MICSKPLIHLLLEQIIPIELEINSDPKKNIAGLFSRCTTPKVTTTVSQSRSGQVEFGGIEERFWGCFFRILSCMMIQLTRSMQYGPVWSCLWKWACLLKSFQSSTLVWNLTHHEQKWGVVSWSRHNKTPKNVRVCKILSWSLVIIYTIPLLPNYAKWLFGCQWLLPFPG